MKAGVAKVNITPPVGTDLAGYGGREKGSRGIADSLYSKSLVLGDGEKSIAIVTNDLIGLDEKSTNKIRKIAEEKTGIKGSNIMISSSHTHSGPTTIFLRGMGRIDADYLSLLERSIAGGISIAFQNIREASLGAGRGKIRINVNRRRRTPEGDLGLLPNPEGVVDDEVGVIVINDQENSPIATLVNYACHAVVLGPENLLISADYPGATQAFIEKERGGISLFANGCCGNLNPIIHPGNFGDVEKLGVLLGKEALKVSKSISTSSEVKFKIASKRISLPLQKFPPLEKMEGTLKEKRKELEEIEKREHTFLEFNVVTSMFEWARDTLKAIKEKKTPGNIEIEIQVFAFNKVVLMVGIPGEVFCEIGLKIKEKSPFDYTFISGYTNGEIGYVPTKEAFSQGGYEVNDAPKWYGISFLSPKVEEILIEEVLKLIEELR